MIIISIRKPRTLGRNMIIVCEDSNTAPNYLFSLKNKAMEMSCWDYIEIYPKPPIDIPTEVVENQHKTPRKKRIFKEIAWLEIELEAAYKEQPVNYVRIAQKVLEEEGYSEGWAVFDLDGHTGHERAALMAQQPPQVHIAFSSRSIEMWFLLHFGRYNHVFQKVHCKDDRKRPLHCNKITPCLDDNKGECLLGFLRRNTVLKNYQKKDDLFAKLEIHLRNAIGNAAWLRMKYAVEQPYYLRNPYTTMDTLVKRLLKWGFVGDLMMVNGFEITIQKTLPSIELKMKNVGKTQQIIQKYHFEFENSAIEFEFFGKGVFEVNASRLVTITPKDLNEVGTANTKLKYPASNYQDFIWILC
jgi:hypothetical protein